MNILIINNEDTLINEIINCSINHNLNIFKCKDIKKNKQSYSQTKYRYYNFRY